MPKRIPAREPARQLPLPTEIIGHEPTPAQLLRWGAEAMANLHRSIDRYRDNPPPGERLPAPACEHACRTCTLTCAGAVTYLRTLEARFAVIAGGREATKPALPKPAPIQSRKPKEAPVNDMTVIATPTPGQPLTMTSREIAELTGKRHDNVMRDIRATLGELMGEGGLLKFEDTHRNPQNGQEYPIYRLPYRESLILASGYDVHLRARIIDRWQQLEAAAPALPAPHPSAGREARLSFRQNLKIATLAGFTGNQALLAANKATLAMTGIDTLRLMNATALPAPENDALLTPTEIGVRSGIGSARAVNQMLCGMGLQHAFRDANGHIYYEPSDDGRAAGARMLDTGKKHGTGAPVRQLKWPSSIIGLLQEGAA
jgi:Rha family phage regulatory protein